MLRDAVAWLQDRSALARAAGALAHALPERKHRAALTRFRSDVAALPPAEDPFVAGYRQALRDVTAAYEGAVEPAERVEQLAAAVGRREPWARLLAGLVGGPRLPGELAAAAELDAPGTSRALAELRNLGLVEHAARRDGEDARTRPHRLTLLGEEVTRCRAEGPSSTEPLVRAACRAFAVLATARRVTPAAVERVFAEALEHDAPEVPPGPAARALTVELEHLGLARELDGVLVATEMTAQTRLAQQLEAAASGATPAAITDLARRLMAASPVGELARPVVRCARLRELWDVVLRTHPDLRRFDGRTITREDLEAGAPGVDDARPYVLVFDGLAQARLDHEADDPAMRRVFDGARARLCFTSEEGGSGPLERGLEPLVVADLPPEPPRRAASRSRAAAPAPGVEASSRRGGAATLARPATRAPRGRGRSGGA